MTTCAQSKALGARQKTTRCGICSAIRAGLGKGGIPYCGGRSRSESGTGPVSTKWGIVGYGVSMPRTARVAPGGMVFHILNRGVARMQLFEKSADYQAFEGVLRETRDQSPMRICALLVDGEPLASAALAGARGRIGRFMRRLTITHVRRWREHRGYARLGHIDQGRYQSFPVESDEPFWVVARMLSAMRCVPRLFCVPRNGDGRVCGVTFTARRRRALVDNVADRGAAGRGRAGQSGRRRERARLAPPKRAPRAPL